MRRREFIAGLGSVALLPSSAKAQVAAKRFRLGYLALTPAENVGMMKVLVDRLRELGWVEGQSLTIEYRSAEGDAKRLANVAAQLVATKPDVLVGGAGTLAPQALKAATTTIPVIFAAVGDPLGANLVASLSRPEGNVTGLSSQVADLGGKRLEILRDLIPLQPRAAKAAAMIVLEDPLTISLRRQIAALTVEHQIPVLSGDKQLTEAGGLISYGPDGQQIYRRAAEYVDKILKGARPQDLPASSRPNSSW